MKTLVTGGSGFIGRWVLQLLQQAGHELVNIDLKKPSFKVENCKFIQADICDEPAMESIFREEQPDYVVHLAARVDLDGTSVDAYKTNSDGVRSICRAVRAASTVKRVIYTSSQLVCQVGYVPAHDKDYQPNNFYGESKVLMEKIVWEESGGGTEWCLVRPTTVWGPFMNEHYQAFLSNLKRGTFFHFSKRPLYKSYSYAGNIAHQYSKLLQAEPSQVHEQVFYLADYVPISLRRYIDLLAHDLGAPKVKDIPYPVAKSMALIGDVVYALGFKKVPFTSFRLKNITTEYQFDMSKTAKVCGDLPYSFEAGVKSTAQWFNSLGK